ncbi:MAG: DUF6789 family protein [Bacillota bacterium]|nr:DUF6789 family protein [Bacillota bacterium]
MKDRFLNGFIAGFLGGVAMSILNLISYYVLNIAELLYLDWASVLIFGYRFATMLEAVIGQLGQLFFSALLGILFAYLLPLTSSRYYLFKGWVYSLVVWFGAYAVATLFKVTPLMPIKPDTVMSNIVTASVYGLVLAETLHRLAVRKV